MSWSSIRSPGRSAGWDRRSSPGRSSMSGCAPVSSRWDTTSPSEGTGRGLRDAPADRERLPEFEVDVVPPLLRGGRSWLQPHPGLLLSGRVREAENSCAGRMRCPAGDPRRRPGTKTGFPTANVEFVQELPPAAGSVRDRRRRGGVVRRGVANVGFNPTFGENPSGWRRTSSTSRAISTGRR